MQCNVKGYVAVCTAVLMFLFWVCFLFVCYYCDYATVLSYLDGFPLQEAQHLGAGEELGLP